jgi:hypothetical protein
MSNDSPRERSRHPLLLALFLVTMIAEIAICFAGSVRSEVQAASVQDPGQGPENMDHEKTINLDGDWVFCGGATIRSCSESPFTCSKMEPG